MIFVSCKCTSIAMCFPFSFQLDAAPYHSTDKQDKPKLSDRTIEKKMAEENKNENEKSSLLTCVCCPRATPAWQPHPHTDAVYYWNETQRMHLTLASAMSQFARCTATLFITQNISQNTQQKSVRCSTQSLSLMSTWKTAVIGAHFFNSFQIFRLRCHPHIYNYAEVLGSSTSARNADEGENDE